MLKRIKISRNKYSSNFFKLSSYRILYNDNRNFSNNISDFKDYSFNKGKKESLNIIKELNIVDLNLINNRELLNKNSFTENGKMNSTLDNLNNLKNTNLLGSNALQLRENLNTFSQIIVLQQYLNLMTAEENFKESNIYLEESNIENQNEAETEIKTDENSYEKQIDEKLDTFKIENETFYKKPISLIESSDLTIKAEKMYENIDSNYNYNDNRIHDKKVFFRIIKKRLMKPPLLSIVDLVYVLSLIESNRKLKIIKECPNFLNYVKSIIRKNLEKDNLNHLLKFLNSNTIAAETKSFYFICILENLIDLIVKENINSSVSTYNLSINHLPQFHSLIPIFENITVEDLKNAFYNDDRFKLTNMYLFIENVIYQLFDTLDQKLIRDNVNIFINENVKEKYKINKFNITSESSFEYMKILSIIKSKILPVYFNEEISKNDSSESINSSQKSKIIKVKFNNYNDMSSEKNSLNIEFDSNFNALNIDENCLYNKFTVKGMNEFLKETDLQYLEDMIKFSESENEKIIDNESENSLELDIMAEIKSKNRLICIISTILQFYTQFKNLVDYNLIKKLSFQSEINKISDSTNKINSNSDLISITNSMKMNELKIETNFHNIIKIDFPYSINSHVEYFIQNFALKKNYLVKKESLEKILELEVEKFDNISYSSIINLLKVFYEKSLSEIINKKSINKNILLFIIQQKNDLGHKISSLELKKLSKVVIEYNITSSFLFSFILEKTIEYVDNSSEYNVNEEFLLEIYSFAYYFGKRINTYNKINYLKDDIYNTSAFKTFDQTIKGMAYKGKIVNLKRIYKILIENSLNESLYDPHFIKYIINSFKFDKYMNKI